MTLIISLLVVVLGGSSAQDYFEGRYVQRYHTNIAHVHEIPKSFEVKGEKAETDIMPLIRDINGLAERRNQTVLYKVRVIVSSTMTPSGKQRQPSTKKSKKYNVPLKRKSMKVSNFELIKNRLARNHEKILRKKIREQRRTTRFIKEIYSTKPPFMGKYKPIPQKVKTNFSKLIKPVRSKVVKLNMQSV